MPAFEAGNANAQAHIANKVKQAQTEFETLGAMAFGVLDGDLNNEPNPERWAQVMELAANSDMDISALKDRPEMARTLALASSQAISAMGAVQNEKQLQLAIDEFGRTIAQDLKGDQERGAIAELLRKRGFNEEADAIAAGVDPKTVYTTLQERLKPTDQPASVDEYNFYVEQEKAAGREPLTLLEFEQAKKGQGLSVTLPDGTTVQQGGSVKLTELQSKQVSLSDRMANATENIGALEQAGYDPANFRDRATAGGGEFTNWAMTPEGQQYLSAAREWISGILRLDSGAAVPEPEFWRYYATYFPQMGDAPATRAQKAQMRKDAEDSIRKSSGGIVDALAPRDDPGQATEGLTETAGDPEIDALVEQYTKQ